MHKLSKAYHNHCCTHCDVSLTTSWAMTSHHHIAVDAAYIDDMILSICTRSLLLKTLCEASSSGSRRSSNCKTRHVKMYIFYSTKPLAFADKSEAARASLPSVPAAFPKAGMQRCVPVEKILLFADIALQSPLLGYAEV